MSVKLVITGQAMHYNQHYLLDGLDVKDQHPIDAIIGLRDELAKRYVLPLGGIPAGDLAETYVSIDDLNNMETSFQTLYTQAMSDININKINIKNNTDNITTNTNDIFNLTSLLDSLKNQVNNLPGADQSIFNNAVCVKQKIFEATNLVKSTDIVIMDTDLKVIEPTVLDSTGLLLNNGTDYTVSYPDDITLRITFINNGIYKINYLSGEISDSEFNILLEYYKKLESKVAMNTNGSILQPAHDIQIIYNDLGNVIREVYTGNINKTVDYTYDASNEKIIKKTVVQDGIIKTANFLYDANGKLAEVQDDGTDIPIDGMKAKSFNLVYEYDDKGFVSKETYTGDINKVIVYQHNNYGDVTMKSVTEDSITKVALYTYDDKRKLVSVNDGGTESIAVVFPNSVSGGGSTGGGTTDTEITDPEIDLIFATIFND